MIATHYTLSLIHISIEEENIVAIYAEDSRETTLENILAAMPYICLLYTSCRDLSDICDAFF